MKAGQGPLWDWCRKHFPNSASEARRILRDAHVAMWELRPPYESGWITYVTRQLEQARSKAVQ